MNASSTGKTTIQTFWMVVNRGSLDLRVDRFSGEVIFDLNKI